MRILLAGFGNPLRHDDGFGVALLERLADDPALPAGVETLEAGIGGISVVQELMTGYDALVVLDALGDGDGDRGGGDDEAAGTIKTLALEVADLGGAPPGVLRDRFADIHYAEPGRALALAKALGALPAAAFMIGCMPRTCALGEGLSAPVRAALEPAAAAALALLRRLAAGEAVEPVPASAEP